MRPQSLTNRKTVILLNNEAGECVDLGGFSIDACFVFAFLKQINTNTIQPFFRMIGRDRKFVEGLDDRSCYSLRRF